MQRRNIALDYQSFFFFFFVCGVRNHLLEAYSAHDKDWIYLQVFNRDFTRFYFI
jgi:hypothetical protein